MATQHDHGHAHGGHGHGAHAAHGAPGHHHSVSEDRAPAFIGLVAGAAFIGAVLFGVVQWTNAQFAGHSEGAKAEATK
jgi:hypothetical protein